MLPRLQVLSAPLLAASWTSESGLTSGSAARRQKNCNLDLGHARVRVWGLNPGTFAAKLGIGLRKVQLPNLLRQIWRGPLVPLPV